LTRYLEDRELAIDNKAAEKALRPVALACKNWQRPCYVVRVLPPSIATPQILTADFTGRFTSYTHCVYTQ
jgi:hypothetical protein